MKKFKVEIDVDTADKVFDVVLKSQYKGLSPNILGVPLFSNDKEENQREFDKLREAFKLIADYNGVKL
jgi:hypothetical protein